MIDNVSALVRRPEPSAGGCGGRERVECPVHITTRGQKLIYNMVSNAPNILVRNLRSLYFLHIFFCEFYSFALLFVSSTLPFSEMEGMDRGTKSIHEGLKRDKYLMHELAPSGAPAASFYNLELEVCCERYDEFSMLIFFLKSGLMH